MPERVITKPPIGRAAREPERPGRLPPYEELDAILQGLVEKELSAREIVAKGHDPAVVSRVQHLLYLAEYKRRQAPPGVKITRRASAATAATRSPTGFARSGSAARGASWA